MPGFIKRVFAFDAGQIMDLYSSGIMAGAVLAAVAAPGLSCQLGWETMLGLWGVPALLALALLLLSSPSGAHRQWVTFSRVDGAPPAGSGRAWLLLLFLGVGTGAYTLMLAWLPRFYVELGCTEDVAGYLLAGLTVMEVLAGLIVSAVINRFPDRRGPLAGSLLAILGGLSIGSLLPLSLIVTLDHAEDPARAGRLTAFVQGGGYMIASIMPFAAGWMRSRSDDFSQAWAVMAVGIVLLLVIALRFTSGGRIR